MALLSERLRRSLVAGALVVFIALAGNAQERPGPTVDLAGAWLGFADDGVVSEGAMGVAVRWYVSPRMALEPELLYMRGDNHSHLAFTGNLTFDLLSEATRSKATPFLVAGAGMFQTRERFPTGNFTSTEGAFTAGGGLRSRMNDRVSVGVDARVGWELHVRAGGFVAIRLGSRAGKAVTSAQSCPVVEVVEVMPTPSAETRPVAYQNRTIHVSRTPLATLNDVVTLGYDKETPWAIGLNFTPDVGERMERITARPNFPMAFVVDNEAILSVVLTGGYGIGKSGLQVSVDRNEERIKKIYGELSRCVVHS